MINKYTIKGEELTEVIGDILTIYSKQVTEEIKKATDKTAEEVLQLVKDNAPVRTGKYRDGWTWKPIFESENEKKDAVYNATSSSLIHLLEFGHVIRNSPEGGRAGTHPHVMPAWEKGTELFTKNIEEAVKNANKNT